MKKECPSFANFEIKKIPRNKNNDTTALATLAIVREVNGNRIISKVIVLVETSMEEVEKTIGNVCEVTTPRHPKKCEPT